MKARRPVADAGEILVSWNASVSIAGTFAEVMMATAELSVDLQVSIWDAVNLAVASQSGCRLLLSEDMHNGFTGVA
jgi:predicted nucleic acid-binding protein